MNNPFELIDARLSNIETLLLDIKHGRLHSKVEAVPFPSDKPFKYSPDTKIANIDGVSARAINTARWATENQQATLLDISKAGRWSCMLVRGCGRGTLHELKNLLTEAGLPFPHDRSE